MVAIWRRCYERGIFVKNAANAERNHGIDGGKARNFNQCVNTSDFMAVHRRRRESCETLKIRWYGIAYGTR